MTDDRWDADGLRRVEPEGTEYDVTPDGAMPPQVIRSDSGPYGQYTPFGEANQFVSMARGAGSRGPLGKVFVWVLVALMVGSVLLGVATWVQRDDAPPDPTSVVDLENP